MVANGGAAAGGGATFALEDGAEALRALEARTALGRSCDRGVIGLRGELESWAG